MRAKSGEPDLRSDAGGAEPKPAYRVARRYHGGQCGELFLDRAERIRALQRIAVRGVDGAGLTADSRRAAVVAGHRAWQRLYPRVQALIAGRLLQHPPVLRRPL